VELLHKSEVERRLNASGDAALYIDPLLDGDQIGQVSVDLRLGYDFLVSLLTRRAFIGIVKDDPQFRGMQSYFKPTRREFGDRFMLYPGQVVIATTLEYIGLPTDVYADVLTRSSYNRLGLSLNTMIQPGFRGCFPVELLNQGPNPVELVVGSRLFQMRLFSLQAPTDYSAGAGSRKYFGDVRPTLSRAAEDADVAVLERIRERR
jgi:dCTP deaminase